MEQFYPDKTPSTSEFDYGHLTIDKISEPFVAYICMCTLALVGLIVEILFDKVRNRGKNNTLNIVESAEENYQIGFIVHFANDTTAEQFSKRFEIFLRDFDVDDVYLNDQW